MVMALRSGMANTISMEGAGRSVRDEYIRSYLYTLSSVMTDLSEESSVTALQFKANALLAFVPNARARLALTRLKNDVYQRECQKCKQTNGVVMQADMQAATRLSAFAMIYGINDYMVTALGFSRDRKIAVCGTVDNGEVKLVNPRHLSKEQIVEKRVIRNADERSEMVEDVSVADVVAELADVVRTERETAKWSSNDEKGDDPAVDDSKLEEEIENEDMEEYYEDNQ
jgi:hypothetical protein